MVEEKKDYILIDFTGLFKAIWRKIGIILLVGIILAGIGGGYGYYQSKTTPYVPLYTSTVKMYVSGDATSQKSAIYYELMRGQKVINQVITDMQLNMSYKELVNCIKKGTIEGTGMFYITVTFPDAQYAKDIVDDLVKLTNAYAFDVLSMNSPIIYEKPQVATKAANSPINNTFVYGLYGGIAGVFLTVIYIVFAFLTDKKIRSIKKLEEDANIPVVGIISKGKNIKSLTINELAMQNFYAHICIMKKEAKVIAFYSMTNEDKSEIVKEYTSFLNSNKKKTVCINIDCVKDNVDKKEQESGTNRSLLDYLYGRIQNKEELDLDESTTEIMLGVNSYDTNAELLCRSEFLDILEWLKERYDYILINTIPLGYAPNSKAIMPMTDMNIAVVELDKTTVEDVTMLKKEFRDNGDITGFVVGNVDCTTKNRNKKKEVSRFVGA